MLFLLLSASLAFADVIHLKSGGKIEGRLTEKGDSYIIETDTGVLTVKKDDVLRIEKKDWAPKKLKMPPKKRERTDVPYAHPFFAFKVYLPPKWIRGETHGKLASCSFYGPEEEGYKPRIDLMIDRETKDMMPYVTKLKDGFKATFKDASFPFEEATTVHGKTAYQFCAAFTDNDLAATSLWTFVSAGDRLYVLSFSTTRARFEKYYSPIDAAMRTIRIYKEPAATQEDKRKFIELYNDGGKAEREGRHDDALKAWQKAAALIPDYPEIHAKIGSAYFQMKNFSDAEAGYRKAIELEPGDFAYHFKLGVCLFQQAKLDDALGFLSKAVELDPNSEDALTNLGAAFLAKALPEKAKEALLRAVEIDPESVPAHFNLGLAYEKLGDRKNAERQFNDVLSLDKNHKGAAEGVARVKRK